jgi:hypothetical protein
MSLPRPRKPAEQLRRRNRPEEWTVLPFEGCSLPAPTWPLGRASKDEAGLWARLWALPIAVAWHDWRIEPAVVARYVRLALTKPEHATVGQLERELGLTPASLLRMRLVVEHPEPEPEPAADPYAHLKAVQ